MTSGFCQKFFLIRCVSSNNNSSKTTKKHYATIIFVLKDETIFFSLSLSFSLNIDCVFYLFFFLQTNFHFCALKCIRLESSIAWYNYVSSGGVKKTKQKLKWNVTYWLQPKVKCEKSSSRGRLNPCSFAVNSRLNHRQNRAPEKTRFKTHWLSIPKKTHWFNTERKGCDFFWYPSWLFSNFNENSVI